MISWLQKIFGINEDEYKIEDKNPDGLTFTQFVDKYPKCRKIAVMCWHLGCYPEELRKELEDLLEDDASGDGFKKKGEKENE